MKMFVFKNENENQHLHFCGVAAAGVGAADPADRPPGQQPLRPPASGPERPDQPIMSLFYSFSSSVSFIARRHPDPRGWAEIVGIPATCCDPSALWPKRCWRRTQPWADFQREAAAENRGQPFTRGSLCLRGITDSQTSFGEIFLTHFRGGDPARSAKKISKIGQENFEKRLHFRAAEERSRHTGPRGRASGRGSPAPHAHRMRGWRRTRTGRSDGPAPKREPGLTASSDLTVKQLVRAPAVGWRRTKPADPTAALINSRVNSR